VPGRIWFASVEQQAESVVCFDRDDRGKELGQPWVSTSMTTICQGWPAFSSTDARTQRLSCTILALFGEMTCSGRRWSSLDGCTGE